MSKGFRMSNSLPANLFTSDAEALTWFAGDSPVRTSLLQARARGLTDHEADCVGRCCVWCAKCNRNGWSLRMFLACSVEDTTKLLAVWKRRVTPAKRSGWELVTLDSRTEENGCGLWPTATVMDSAGFMGKPDKGRVGPNSGNTLNGKVMRT